MMLDRTCKKNRIDANRSKPRIRISRMDLRLYPTPPPHREGTVFHPDRPKLGDTPTPYISDSR